MKFSRSFTDVAYSPHSLFITVIRIPFSEELASQWNVRPSWSSKVVGMTKFSGYYNVRERENNDVCEREREMTSEKER